MIKTKSIYDSAEPSDGTRILVTRFHPRKKGFRKGAGYDLWLRGPSPDKDLLKAYRQGNVTPEQFSETCLEHLRADEGKYSSEKGSALCAMRSLTKATMSRSCATNPKTAGPLAIATF
ncbi:MAG: DUF488 family protein, N3 subclade [Nitrososphaera sp.]|uniref:DUF488 family protein, N3 subclade n=1 Tax=Nitrososphaera sp. TaxID=1971748 RepID=UPI003D6EFAAC